MIAEFDCADFDLVIAANHRDLISTLQLRDGALGNEQGRVFGCGDGAHATVLSGAQNISWIWKHSGDPNCPRFLINLTVRVVETTLLWISGTVCEHQLQLNLGDTGSLSRFDKVGLV